MRATSSEDDVVTVLLLCFTFFFLDFGLAEVKNRRFAHNQLLSIKS